MCSYFEARVFWPGLRIGCCGRDFFYPELEEMKIKAILIRPAILVIVCVPILSTCAQATVFINEVFINPPGATDDSREFIELLGTPGKKLDGYAIAVLNGTEEKYYPLGSIPPEPPDYNIPPYGNNPEIDEFFSLDGLALGKNGILVLGIQNGTTFWYPALLSDSNFARWTTLWNGGLDVPGQLGNNGSFTIILIRNRPGQTEADPCDPNGLRWAKEITHDAELITPVQDSNGQWKDQWGDGNPDKGQANGLGGYTLDLVGANTPGDTTDDLEVVDEVSFEDGRGWEYDTDGRHVDANSNFTGLPHRHVHALDDPIGFSPDALSRVDYRTKGDGWTPAGGGTGEMPDGNNWQDTATEQWIRGESTTGNVPSEGNRLGFFYDNSANPEPNAVQPYETHVPLWLDDGNAPDYDFGTAATYEITAGRINPLAVPFIPGDCDRDGLCDANDISKIAAVFGDNDWLFSNGFPEAPEGDSCDPATQTRPWDVDATGDNGIEASDLQWMLNFQGNTTGQVVGVQYDSNIPAGDINNVHLNPNTAVECNVTTSVNIPSGHSLTALRVDDIIEVTVSGQVTAGPNTTIGQENGIMQYVHDVAISSGGIIKVTLIEPLGSFSTTRASLEDLQGTNGDLGAELINGFTTSFTEGLTGTAGLYRLTLQAIGEGSVDVTISPAAAARFAAGTPHGLKVGHTDSHGDPNSSIYPASLFVRVVPPEDLDGDGSIGLGDLEIICENWLEADPNMVLLSSRLLHWKMNDDANDTTVLDSSDYVNDGTAQQNTSVLHTTGKIDGALTFNGSSDLVQVSYGPELDFAAEREFTIAAWIYADNFVNAAGIFRRRNSKGIIFEIQDTKRLRGYIDGASGNTGNFYSESNVIEVDTWYFVAMVSDGNNVGFYIDGVPSGTPVDISSVGDMTDTVRTLKIGRSMAYFNGVMDNVMVFDKALTAEEIGLLYNGGNGTETVTVGEVEGDINGDAIVDVLDFTELARAWQL